ncbi:hypothetical protein D3C85_1681750 [compost metagenome]
MGETADLPVGLRHDDLEFAAAADRTQVIDFVRAGADIGGVDRIAVLQHLDFGPA